MSSCVMDAQPSVRALELFRPRPGVLYSLDVAAQLAGVSRRSILIYCRAGLIQPLFLLPYGAMAFAEEAICAVRRLERMRAVHGIGVVGLKTLLDLVEEVERLRVEVRVLRDSAAGTEGKWKHRDSCYDLLRDIL